ncbi:MAG: hypothetical protein L6Q95_13195 [Planctomycetes bacterium]|nr:hypothetical protein [Planctomycetota bacterium]
MILLLAAAAYAASAWIYFRGRFGLAALGGAVYWALMAFAAMRYLGAPGGAVAFALLAVAPGVYLAVHAVDARKGLFLLPTIYSIPIAFVCGILLWAVVAAGAILR